MSLYSVAFERIVEAKGGPIVATAATAVALAVCDAALSFINAFDDKDDTD